VFQAAGFGVETLDGEEAVGSAKSGARHGALHGADRFVVDGKRHGEGVAVLAAVRHGEARGIAEACRRAVHDLGDEGEGEHGAWADARGQEEIGEVDRRSLVCGGDGAAEAALLHVLGADLVVKWQLQHRAG